MKQMFSAVIFLTITLLAAGPALHAQNKKKPPQKSHSKLAKEAISARNEVIKAANEYKESLDKLIVLLEIEMKEKAEAVERMKGLVEQRIAAKRELEESERALAAVQTKVAEARSQIAGADTLIAEVKAAEQVAKLPPMRVGGYRATAALIRYNGPAGWILTDAAKVQGFFAARFGHALPISAFGQTAVHDRLGFDHRNAMDVAVHPDSAEGQALIAYLRGAGITFIAFRQAVPGSATGAHIHIGNPSRRIAR